MKQNNDIFMFPKYQTFSKILFMNNIRVKDKYFSLISLCPSDIGLNMQARYIKATTQARETGWKKKTRKKT